MTQPQADLFGDDLLPELAPQPASEVKPSRKRSIVACSPSEAVRAVALALPSGIRLGTSSWSFPGWNGLVYDGEFRETALARDGLNAYAQHPLFCTVGIDRTFYAPIAEHDYAKYAAQVPADFRFLVKAPMAVTSSYIRDDSGKNSPSPYFLDLAYAIDEFVSPCVAGLKEKAGPLVFQFPPQGWSVTREPDPFINRLYRFLKGLPLGPIYAVEVRDRELLTDRFFMCLKATGVRFCVASHARMPSPREQIERANTIVDPGAFVARWSLHSGFKYEDAKSRYFPFDKLVDDDFDSRNSIAEACVRAIEAGFPAYVVVNNKAEGSAPLSVEKLAQRIGELSIGLKLR